MPRGAAHFLHSSKPLCESHVSALLSVFSRLSTDASAFAPLTVTKPRPCAIAICKDGVRTYRPGGGTRVRTGNLRIQNPLFSQLNYAATRPGLSRVSSVAHFRFATACRCRGRSSAPSFRPSLRFNRFRGVAEPSKIALSLVGLPGFEPGTNRL